MNSRKIAAFAVGPIGSAALGLITVPVITWFFSAEDIGRISMLQVTSSFCILLFSLGLDQAYVREYHESKNKPKLLKSALVPGLLLLIFALFLCLMLPGGISKALFAVDSMLFSLLITLCIVAAFISRFFSLILRMQEKGFAYSMSQILPKLIFLIIIFTYAFILLDFELLHLIIAHTISIISVTVIYGWNTRKECLASLKHKIDGQKLKFMLRFGMPLIVGGVAYWGLRAMDKVFLRNLSTFNELGIYSVAASFAGAAIIFQNVFSTVWAPTVYKWSATGNNLEKIDQITEHILGVVVSLFSLAGLFSWITKYLLPPGYGTVQYIVVACMAHPLFYTLSETTVVGLGITRKSSYAMAASIIAMLVNFIGNYLLVPAHGATGAAISTSISFWVFFVCRSEFAFHAWRPLPRFKLYTYTFLCLCSAIAFAFLGKNNDLAFLVIWVALLGMNIAVYKHILLKAVSIFI